MEQQVLRVSQVNEQIRDILDHTPQLQSLLVRGEISNYKLYPSGHHYFTLKDEESAIRCVMFRGQASRLRFRPENGMKVIARGRISVFPRDGAYQLYCDGLAPDGMGDLHLAFEQLKEKLWKEGLFESSHKLPLPSFPQTIAIVTSPAGAAIHDMLRILRRRYPIAKVVLLPVRVQGVEAPAEIAGAIRYASRQHLADLLIVGRGGGSMEDLWAFNDERVAHAIYDCTIPTISAVGHEPDVTISDFVADVRAATPSHAAELAVPDRAELLAHLQQLQERMAVAPQRRLEFLQQKLDKLSKARVLTDPMAAIQNKQLLLDSMQRDLSYAAQRHLQKPQQKLAALAASLDALSPLKVLSRGYSFVTDSNGNIVKSGSDVAVGDTIHATLTDTILHCRVEGKEPYGNKKREVF